MEASEQSHFEGRAPITKFVYAAVFLDLFGFGMLVADIQFLAERLGAPGWLIGLVLASTFIVQVPLSPYWGRLSDRIGRKPVFVACTLLSAFSMALYGVAGSVLMLITSRVVAGLGGANVAVAQALLADATPVEERSIAMGRIGAAVTLGLVGGPVVGGFIAPGFGSSVVGFVAAACSMLGALLALLFVPSVRPEAPAESLSVRIGLLKSLPRLRSLVVLAAVSWFALATLEGTFGRLIKHTLGFDQSHFGIVFGWESLLGFIVQGLLLVWFARRMGDRVLLRFAYVVQGVGLTMMPFVYLFPVQSAWLGALLVCGTLYALGSSLANPTINGLCSKATPAERQGELFGLLQGARSVGFIVGPVLGGALFDAWFAAPYLLAGATCVVASLLVPSESAPQYPQAVGDD